MTSGNDNRKDRRRTITIEQWDGSGALDGCYLVSLLESARPEPIDGRICGSKDEAYDYAREIMKIYPNAVFHDQSEDSGQ